MQVTDNQYIEVFTKTTSIMHDLSTNFDRFLEITKQTLVDVLNEDGNVQRYRHSPKLPDSHVIALSLCQEALGIDSERYLWSKLQCDYTQEFTSLIHLTGYNRRRKRLAGYIHKLNQRLASSLNEGERVFIIDSIPIPICKMSRARRLKICRKDFETAPDKGFSPSVREYFFGYKLHLVTSVRGVFSSMEITKASVHDVRYLSDIKYSGLNNCTLLGDKGYISTRYQNDLFAFSRIDLQVPKKSNQKGSEDYPLVFRQSRKRIETIFSQLCDQMMLKRNYAKSYLGVNIRLLSKMAAITVLQHINACNGRPLNHIKNALAA